MLVGNSFDLWKRNTLFFTVEQGGVARMSEPQLIKEIKQTFTIPVMAKARIEHFVEAQILEAIGVDYVDESEVTFVVNLFN